jgi:hypothetical protein
VGKEFSEGCASARPILQWARLNQISDVRKHVPPTQDRWSLLWGVDWQVPVRRIRIGPMPYDAFISYCSEDKKVAEAACGTLGASRIRFWIAPRHVLPRRTWGLAIVDAIGVMEFSNA